MKDRLKQVLSLIPLVSLTLAVGYYAMLQIRTIFERPQHAVTLAPVRPRVKHDVTDRMLFHSIEMSNVVAPDFDCFDGTGKRNRLADLVQAKPVVLVFIKDGCPCSIAAQPFFDELAEAFEGSVTFLGVIDGPKSVASKWAEKYKSAFPLLADENLKTITAYGVESSAHVALIGQDKKLIRLWPGFSKPMLLEMNQMITALGFIPKHTMIFTDAPEELTTGCPFDVDL